MTEKTTQILSKNRLYFQNIEWTKKKVSKEIEESLKLLNSVEGRIISFFGSHKVESGNEYYDDAHALATELAKKGNTIISGGGPGIMEAANCGAKEAGGESIGIQADLIKGEQIPVECFTKSLPLHFLFTRRFALAVKSEVLIFYPGGYGTLNELFEYATLMSTDMVDRVPIICVNEKYWRGLFTWIKENPLKEDFLKHDMTDLELLHFVDDHQGALDLIEKTDAKNGK